MLNVDPNLFNDLPFEMFWKLINKSDADESFVESVLPITNYSPFLLENVFGKFQLQKILVLNSKKPAVYIYI